jgi:hypothetical protein
MNKSTSFCLLGLKVYTICLAPEQIFCYFETGPMNPMNLGIHYTGLEIGDLCLCCHTLGSFPPGKSPVGFVVQCVSVVFLGSRLPGDLSLQSCKTLGQTSTTGVEYNTSLGVQHFPFRLRAVTQLWLPRQLVATDGQRLSGNGELEGKRAAGRTGAYRHRTKASPTYLFQSSFKRMLLFEIGEMAQW